MHAELITETNSDLAVVNAARVSFAKESQWETGHVCAETGDVVNKPCETGMTALGNIPCCPYEDKRLSHRDRRLLSYLAMHGHWTPFAHPREVFRLRMNKDAWLQLLAHGTEGLDFNPASFDSPYWDRITATVSGSLYAWLTKPFPGPVRAEIHRVLTQRYPNSTQAFHVSVDNSQTPVEKDDVVHIPVEKLADEPINHYVLPVTLRVKAPIAVKIQMFKHKMGFVENEISRRYVDDDPTFYYPPVFWRQHENKKQGASEEDWVPAVPFGGENVGAHQAYAMSLTQSRADYARFVEADVAREQARFLLPTATNTEWYWTATLSNWLRMLDLRLAKDTQGETRKLAEKIRLQIARRWPNAFKYWEGQRG